LTGTARHALLITSDNWRFVTNPDCTRDFVAKGEKDPLNPLFRERRRRLLLLAQCHTSRAQLQFTGLRETEGFHHPFNLNLFRIDTFLLESAEAWQ